MGVVIEPELWVGCGAEGVEADWVCCCHCCCSVLNVDV